MKKISVYTIAVLFVLLLGRSLQQTSTARLILPAERMIGSISGRLVRQIAWKQ